MHVEPWLDGVVEQAEEVRTRVVLRQEVVVVAIFREVVVVPPAEIGGIVGLRENDVRAVREIFRIKAACAGGIDRVFGGAVVGVVHERHAVERREDEAEVRPRIRDHGGDFLVEFGEFAAAEINPLVFRVGHDPVGIELAAHGIFAIDGNGDARGGGECVDGVVVVAAGEIAEPRKAVERQMEVDSFEGRMSRAFHEKIIDFIHNPFLHNGMEDVVVRRRSMPAAWIRLARVPDGDGGVVEGAVVDGLLRHLQIVEIKVMPIERRDKAKPFRIKFLQERLHEAFDVSARVVFIADAAMIPDHRIGEEVLAGVFHVGDHAVEHDLEAGGAAAFASEIIVDGGIFEIDADCTARPITFDRRNIRHGGKAGQDFGDAQFRDGGGLVLAGRHENDGDVRGAREIEAFLRDERVRVGVFAAREEAVLQFVFGAFEAGGLGDDIDGADFVVRIVPFKEIDGIGVRQFRAEDETRAFIVVRFKILTAVERREMDGSHFGETFRRHVWLRDDSGDGLQFHFGVRRCAPWIGAFHDMDRQIHGLDGAVGHHAGGSDRVVPWFARYGGECDVDAQLVFGLDGGRFGFDDRFAVAVHQFPKE